MPVVAGVFIGGKGRRLGGVAKGLLRTGDGQTLIERWRALLATIGPLEVILVGAGQGYEALGLEQVEDRPPGIGPLGGLIALLERAGASPALALACDMPFVSRGLIERLISTPAPAPVLAPRRTGRWEPLCARYDATSVLPLAVARADGPDHSLQRLLDQAGALELPLLPDELDDLRDWDTPADLPRPTQ